MEIFGFYITGYQVAFAILAGLTLMAAGAVVLLPNLLRAAMCLGLSLFCIAGLYALMNAPFMAAIQVMIYVGAITTMIILAIFLSNRVMRISFLQAIYNPMLAAGAAGLMFLFLFITVVNSVWVKGAVDIGPAVNGQDVPAVAQALLQPYVFPFELASVVLLAVLVGAVVIAKEDVDGE